MAVFCHSPARIAWAISLTQVPIFISSGARKVGGWGQRRGRATRPTRIANIIKFSSLVAARRFKLALMLTRSIPYLVYQTFTNQKVIAIYFVRK